MYICMHAHETSKLGASSATVDSCFGAALAPSKVDLSHQRPRILKMHWCDYAHPENSHFLPIHSNTLVLLKIGHL